MRRPGRAFSTLLSLLIGVAICGLTTACTPSISQVAASSSANKFGPPAQLAFNTEPSASAGAGIVFGTQPVVQIEDASGNVVTTANSTVTLAAYTNAACTTPAPGTFTVSNNSLSATSGVATFAGVNYGGTTTTIYIGASSAGLTSACSNAITITPGSPKKLVFSTQPSTSGTAGVAFSTQPGVTVEDAYGNVVTSAANAVTLAAYTDSACTTAGTGTFSASTNPLTPTSGVATFWGVNYTKSGTFYIGASSSGLTSACSNAISVAAGPPTKLVWMTSPSRGLVNQCLSTFWVGVQDNYGNWSTVTGSNVTVNLGGSGTTKFYSDSSCTTQITSAVIGVGGTATGGFYSSDSAVESESDIATTTTGLTSGSQSVLWQLNPVVSFSPSAFTVGTCVPFTITLEDAKGTAMAVPDNETMSLNKPGLGSTYSDSSCTTAISSGSLAISSGQSSVTYYYSDLHAESFSTNVYGSGGYIGWGSPSVALTISAGTPTVLRITGPTFESPGTCAGPYTVTSVDSNLNPSNITGPALTVNLSATGSASLFGNSSCSGPPSSMSIGVGADSATFYVKDSATEISTITASATSFTSGTFNYDSIVTSPLEQVAVGGPFTCVLISGNVKCWGNNWRGDLGNGTTTNSFTPVAVSGLSGVSSLVSTTDSNNDGLFSCALKTDNTIWCWGAGYNIATWSSTPVEITLSGSPLLATQISIGGNEACAITSTGAVYCWGDSTPNTSTPTEMVSSGVVSVATLDDHTCATLSSGDLKCWGNNKYGQLGLGSTGGTYTTPQLVSGLTTGVTSAAVSKNSTCAVVSGAVYCWSTNVASGQSANTDTPALVGSPLTSGVSSIVGGDTIYNGNDFFFAITTSGALYGWGANSNPNDGIFGNGATTGYTYTSPFKIISSGVQSAAAAIYNSANACAIVSGNLMCWGNNSSGQLGTGMWNDSYTPVYTQSLE